MDQTTDTRPGYAYWHEHGGSWATEYDQRKESAPLYHIQELMLATYFDHSAPARVLEYGCGTGRHLRYLRQLPGVDVFGYDQSPTMVRVMTEWASEAWLAERVIVGAPVGRLPYPDGYFDIAYTAEVLVHVHPEDIDAILTELVRVSRWQVLHLEPSLDFVVHRGAHAGSWSHDLPAAYLRLSRKCEVLPAGYTAHTPYRVVLDPTRRPWTWSPVALALCRRLERDLQRGLDARESRGDLLEAERARLDGEHERLEAVCADLRQRLDAERGDAAELRQRLGQLESAFNAATVRADELARRLRRLQVTQLEFVRNLDGVIDSEQ